MKILFKGNVLFVKLDHGSSQLMNKWLRGNYDFLLSSSSWMNEDGPTTHQHRWLLVKRAWEGFCSIKMPILIFLFWPNLEVRRKSKVILTWRTDSSEHMPRKKKTSVDITKNYFSKSTTDIFIYSQKPKEFFEKEGTNGWKKEKKKKEGCVVSLSEKRNKPLDLRDCETWFLLELCVKDLPDPIEKDVRISVSMVHLRDTIEEEAQIWD